MSACGVHRPPSKDCEACVQNVVATLLKNVVGLGPRSQKQMEALETAVKQTAPWFCLSMCGPKLKRLSDGTTADATYALAIDIAAACLDPEPFNLKVPQKIDRNALRAEVRANGPAAKIVDIFWGPNDVEMVRARSLHNARDKRSLVAALRRAGVAGISRGVIAAEYDRAYIDIETLIPETVFATEHHAWHRDVAPKRIEGVLEAAREAGLVGPKDL